MSIFGNFFKKESSYDKQLKDDIYLYQRYGEDFSETLNDPKTSKKEKEYIKRIMKG